jgi:DNA mismatch endonuclease (patch repair protein)
MRAVRGRNNRTTEIRFRLALVRYGIRGWTVTPKGVPGNPDFWFEDARVAVFVDGCFWHGCPVCYRAPKSNVAFWIAKVERNKKKDQTITKNLESTNIVVIRLWEHELKADLRSCVWRVNDVIHSMSI